MQPNLQFATQAGQILSKCGKPVTQIPSGNVLAWPYKGFLVQAAFPANPQLATPPSSALQTLRKEITGPTMWSLRAIQANIAAQNAGVSVQIRKPNGRYLISNLQDLGMWAGFGSNKFLLTQEVDCEPGSIIEVSFADTNPTFVQPAALLFEGFYKWPVAGAVGDTCPDSLPRIFGTPNQNILAPCWMSGVGPTSSTGCKDDWFTYQSVPQGGPSTANSSLLTAISTSGNLTATAQIQIESTSDFLVRKWQFDITADVGVTGSVLVSVRLGSGYQHTNDYLDAPRYLANASMAKDLFVAAGDVIYLDLQLVDYSGNGNVYFQAFAEGVKRQRRIQ